MGEDPISFVVKALELGAAAGMGKVATEAFTDSYAGLKELVRRRVSNNPAAETALANLDLDPEVETAIIKSELIKAGADSDADLIRSAQRLMSLADNEGIAAKFSPQFFGPVNRVAIGDHMNVDMSERYSEEPK